MPTAAGQNRRITLGVVNGNQKSRDATDGIGPPSAHKKKPPRSRQSMIPRVGRENHILASPGGAMAPTQASLRRRSIVGTENNKNHSHNHNNNNSSSRRQSHLPQPSAVKTDPRPINDKAYQQDCIKRLLSYLRKNGYDNVTHKSLSRPSGKDFANIVTFMLRRIDSNFQDGPMKFEDEVAMNFKAIGYPFPISKTALVAAGSPHTWPTLLAALTWLMEHIECLENEDSDDEEIEAGAGKPFDTLEELEQNTDKAFFKYLSLAYTAFLKGDEELTEQLEYRLADRFERDDAIIEQEIERVTDLNGAIVEKISHLTKDTEDLPSYTRKREDYATDLEQFHDLIRQMDEHIAGLKQKLNERTKELESTNEKLDKMNTHVEELKNVISNQELSVADIRRIQNEQKGVEEAIERSLVLKEKKQQALLASEEQLSTLFKDLELVVVEYNTKLGDVALLPVVSEKSINMKADLNKNYDPQRDQAKMLGINLRSVILPTLLKCKDEYMDMAADERWKYQEALDRKELSIEALTDAVEKAKIIEAKKMKSLEAVASERDTQEAKLAVRLREVEAMESKAVAVRDPVELEEKIARYERRCTELQALRVKNQEETKARKKVIAEDIDAACRMITEFEEYWRTKQIEFEQYCSKKLAELGQLKKPKDN